MNIAEPYARIMGAGDSPFNERDGVLLLKKIEWAARISHRSEDAQTADSWDRFIRAVVLQHGDWSVVEHASLSVDMLVDRGITHEVVRHRLFGFTQESTRFVNYEKKMPPSFIKPEFKTELAETHWNAAIQSCEFAYREMLMAGETPQIARSVFPNALASRIKGQNPDPVRRHRADGAAGR